MTNKKEEWIEVQEAARIMTRTNKRPVHPDYVRSLSHMGCIRRKQKDKRTNLYNRQDVETYRIKTLTVSNRPKALRAEQQQQKEHATC